MNSDLDFSITVVTPLQQNCCLVMDRSSKTSVVIDPGGDVDKILAMIREHDFPVQAIWLTHGHIDHIAGVAELRRHINVPIIGPHHNDAEFISRVAEIAPQYGMPPTSSFVPDQWLSDDDALTLGDMPVVVKHCPGHSPGSVAFVFPKQSFAFVGDVLFQGSIGRTDLPGSCYDDLISSITNKLWPLGNLRFVCGHGNGSTFAQERSHNAFVADHILKSQSRDSSPGT